MLKKLKAYIELMKPFSRSKSTLYYGLCSLIGSLLVASHNLPLIESFKAAVAVTLSAFAIYTLNDICDVEIDRINAPERPLPSGRVGMREAEVLTVVLFIVASAIASTVNLAALAFVTLFSILGIAYSIPPIRLKDGWFANICWGLGIGVTVLCGASVVAITLPPIIAAATLTLLTAGCGLIKDLKDMEGDRAMGIRTIPLILGGGNAIKLMTITSAAGFPLLPLFGIVFYGLNIPYLTVVTIAIVTFTYSLLTLYKNPRRKNVYEKAYKIQAASGFLINIAFILLGSLT